VPYAEEWDALAGLRLMLAGWAPTSIRRYGFLASTLQRRTPSESGCGGTGIR